MNEIKATVLTVCVVLVGTELISRLIPKNKMIAFVRSLVVTVLLVSAISTWVGRDFGIDFATGEAVYNEELEEYMNQQVENAVQAENARYIAGLLETIQIEAQKVEVFTDINEDGRILIEKVSVTTRYESDKERALALLKNTVGSDFEVEVNANGS